MNGKYFLDTNIFVYSFDKTAPEKQNIAKELIQQALENQKGCISFQVIQEFLSVNRKFVNPLTPDDCKHYLRVVFKPLLCVQSSVMLYEQAVDIKNNFQFSFYDSLIIAAAQQAKCQVLYSEDLQHQQNIDGLVIINPFK